MPNRMTNMAQNDEIILININGADRPGVTAALTEILAKNNAVILDIGQADIHNHLSLGILFQSVSIHAPTRGATVCKVTYYKSIN